MVKRFDEDLSIKASKLSLYELRKHIEKKYTVATEIEKSEDQMLERIERSDDQITELQEQMERLNKHIRMTVKAEVRRTMLFKDPNESA